LIGWRIGVIVVTGAFLLRVPVRLDDAVREVDGAKRVRFAAATVCANSVRAGTIDSSIGSASVTPSPWRTVRRERCFW
jgi:hypothetical protein